jgi:apolipoprotein N-acyltransferase
VIIQAVLFILPVVLNFLNRTEQALGLFFGIFLIFLNFLFFFWLGSSQKLFAVKTPIVVIKYAIWGGLTYLVLNKTNADPLFFVVGLSMVIPSLLILAVFSYRLDNKKRRPNVSIIDESNSGGWD